MRYEWMTAVFYVLFNLDLSEFYFITNGITAKTWPAFMKFTQLQF